MSTHAVVFDKLWQEMKDAEVKPEETPAVFGGQFEGDDVSSFLDKWQRSDLQMPWRIWEHVSSIGFGKPNAIPQDLKYLQRAELFGEGGHLSLRRDGHRWSWHFIGTKGTNLPMGIEGEPYQLGHDAQLRCYKEQAILWGEEVVLDKDGKKTGTSTWWEDRVGAADLSYPKHLSGIPRVYLHFDRYSQAGRTIFVWYKGMGTDTEVKPWP